METSYKHLYETITESLVQKGYAVIENALSPSTIQRLAQHATSLQNYKEAGISANTQLHIDKNRRRDKIHWLEDDNAVEKSFLEFAEGLRLYLNRSLFLGLHYYEAHFAKYEVGDFYEKHLDAFKNSKNRVVTTVYYLNDTWQQSDGGELVIYDKNDTVLEKLLPTRNTLVVFLSEEFPHEVLPANKTRHSIAGWFRIDKV